MAVRMPSLRRVALVATAAASFQVAGTTMFAQAGCAPEEFSAWGSARSEHR